jgi:hypothetical protein
MACDVAWISWIRASWYNYENNQQAALYRLIYYSKSALRVPGDIFAHRQEHLTVFTYLVVFTQVATSCFRQQLGWTLSDTDNTVKCSSRWAKHCSEHVELTWNNKLMYIVRLVGYFHTCHVTMFLLRMFQMQGINLHCHCSPCLLLVL